MKLVGRLAVVAVLVAAVLPEVSRWLATRRLYRATSALRIVLAGGAPDPAAALTWAEAEAAGAARDLPGDPAPLAAAGAARLIAKDPAGALRWYGRAMALGERAEIDLNIGRALMMQRDLHGAQVAFLRAGWLDPKLLAELPEVARKPLEAELDRLSGLLATGQLTAAPPPPTLPAEAM